MIKWYYFENAGRFNDTNFSFIANKDDCKVKYDVLELNYKIACTALWFTYSSRKRDGEEITNHYKNVEIIKTIDEINSIPLFKEKFGINNTDQMGVCEEIDDYINGNEKVFDAILERYKNEIGELLYPLGKTDYQVDRYSSINNLYSKFCKEFINVDKFVTNEQMRRCVII